MWNKDKRCAVTLSVDFDAESLWAETFGLRTPSPLSRGDYEIRAGLPRLLNLFDRHELPVTFMVPGIVAETQRDACWTIAERGHHEVGYHGYYHESVLEIPLEEERELMTRGIEMLEKVFGQTPRGNRTPPFALGPNTAELLEEFDFLYDSSLFGHDQPYQPRIPSPAGKLYDLVELPVSWELDDAPYFMWNPSPNYMSGLCTPGQVLEIWKAEFQGIYNEGGCFLLVLHPVFSGRHARVAMLDELIAYIKSFPGVWFATHLDVAEDWKARQVESGLWTPPS